MKKITKILALLLALVLVLSLAACQEKESSRRRNKSDKDDAEVVETGKTAPEDTKEGDDPEETKEDDDPVKPDVTVGGEIVGEWKTTLDLVELLDAAAAAGEEDVSEQMELFKTLFDGIDGMDMKITFEADGKYSLGVDPESAEALAEALKKNIVAILPSIMGTSEEEFEAYLEESGMTREQFAEAVASEIDTEEMIEGLSGAGQGGTYTYKDGKLWLTEEGETEDPDSYWVVEISGDELRVTDIVGKDADEEDAAAIKDEMLPLVFHRVG